MNFTQLIDYLRHNMALIIMLFAVLISALFVIYSKHIGRTEFVALQKLEKQRDNLNEEWGRLLLEESTWATPGRVEQQAANRLNMIVPSPDMIVVIKP